jgi:hypothetical protein
LGRCVGIAALCWAMIFVAGCGGGGSSSTGQIRFVQASPSAPHVDFLIDGTTETSNMAYGNASGYVAVKTGSRHLQAIPVNSTSPLLDLSVPVASSGNSTVLLTGPGSSVKSLVLTDGGTTSSTGNGYVRVVNASVSMGPADVYIVAPGSGINGATPAATNLGLSQDGGYTLTPAGNYEVFMTSPGSKSILLDTGPINLTSLQNWTLIALDSVSGGFTFELFQDQ